MTTQSVQVFEKNRKIPLESTVFANSTRGNQSLLTFVTEELAVLQENWDGYGGLPMDKKVLFNVNFLLNKLPNNVINKVNKKDILPNPNGTISIEWVNNRNELFLEIGTHYSTYYIKNNGKLCKINNQFIMSNQSELRQFIKELHLN